MNYLYIFCLLPFFSSAQFRDTLLIVEVEKWDAEGDLSYSECCERDDEGKVLTYTSNLYSFYSTSEYDSLGKIRMELYFDNLGGKLSDSIRYTYSPEMQTRIHYNYAGNGGYYLLTTQMDLSGRPFYESTVTYDGFFKSFSSELVDSIFYNPQGFEIERRTYDMLGDKKAFSTKSSNVVGGQQIEKREPLKPGSLSKRKVKIWNEKSWLLLEELTYTPDGIIERVVCNSYDSLNRLIGSEEYFPATPDFSLKYQYSYEEEGALLYKRSANNASIGHQIEVYEAGRNGKCLEHSSWTEDTIIMKTMYEYNADGYLIAEEESYYSDKPIINMPDFTPGGRTKYTYATYPGFR